MFDVINQSRGKYSQSFAYECEDIIKISHVIKLLQSQKKIFSHVDIESYETVHPSFFVEIET